MKKTVERASESANHIAVFQETTIRRVWHNEEWWFAIVDVVSVLTDSVQPEGYVKDLRRRDPELANPHISHYSTGWAIGTVSPHVRLVVAPS